jgi:hypothetical protein
MEPAEAGFEQDLGERQRRVLTRRRSDESGRRRNAALPRRRVNSACSSALITSGVALVVLTRQPRTRRE